MKTRRTKKGYVLLCSEADRTLISISLSSRMRFLAHLLPDLASQELIKWTKRSIGESAKLLESLKNVGEK